ncbi:osteopetrosis-associated transmembrane protein 1 [Drosophila nasuta]|uniref:osteopetrosis-associated transmembrane protein 1 n=1 Tax=Drosophila nasuta TaxID=42062 RepID=UPI00295E636F|nr:osteopetrosis-associated transmembrane protein 1 [Drosophila nasuta]
MRELVLLMAILSCLTHAVVSLNCTKDLHHLADKQMYFIICTTTHAVPVRDERICGSCKSQNDEMVASYNGLMQNCSDLYKDVNRLNIVITTHELLEGLWNKAYCENCFESGGHLWNNFTDLYYSFLACNRSTNAKDICTECKSHYLNMNDFYTDLDKSQEGHICFDIQDIMNSTRVLWSKQLKCCQREVKMTTFLTSVGVVALLPLLLFYGTAIVLTKRREARHGLLNDQEPELDAPSTSQLITAAILSTPSESSAAVTANTEKIAKLLTRPEASSDSSDSDDEPAIKPKIN